MNPVALLNRCYSDLNAVQLDLKKTKNGYAEKGARLLLIFRDTLKQCNELKFSKTIERHAFRDCMAVLTQSTHAQLMACWYNYVPLETANKNFSDFVSISDEILELFSQLKKSAPLGNAHTFIADMTTYARLSKEMFYALSIGLKIKVINESMQAEQSLHKVAALQEVVKMLEISRTECAYLERKIVQLKPENIYTNSAESQLKQCLYMTLHEYADLIFLDTKTRKVIENINPKSLLKAIRNETVINTVSQTLALAVKMANRMVNANNPQLAWGYLQYYFDRVDEYLAKRQGTEVAEVVLLNQSHVKSKVSLLLRLINARIRQGKADFSEDFAHIQILLLMNKLGVKYKPDELTDVLFQELKKIVETRQTVHWSALQGLLDKHLRCVNEGAVRQNKPYVHFVLPPYLDCHNIGLIKRLQKELKNQGCTLKCTLEGRSLKTGDLYKVTLQQIEIFCRTYASLVKDVTPSIESTTESFQRLEIASKDVVSGRKYLQEIGTLPAKEKSRGVAGPTRVDEAAIIAPVNRFEKLFGQEFRDADIMRCRMKSALNNVYVCFDEKGGNDNTCTEEEYKSFKKLFSDPKQAVKEGDQGFKLTRINNSREVVLCAKILGKGGHLRAYPCVKVVGSDNSSVLWVFRTIVRKESQKAKNHGVKTWQANDEG